MNTRFDDWVTAHLAEIETARRYVRNYGVRALAALGLDSSRMKPDERREVTDALTYAVLEEAAERLQTYYSVEALYRDTRVQAFYGALDYRANGGRTEIVHAAIKNDVLLNWHLLAHAHAGKRVYEVSPALGKKLRFTDLRGLTCNDLRLPFPAVLLLVPDSADLRLPGPNGWQTRVTEIYIVEETPPKRVWQLLVLGQGSEMEAKRSISFPLPEGARIDDAVALVNAALEEAERPLLLNGGVLTAGSALSPDKDRHDLLSQWEPLFRWAMNVIVYATNDGERQEIWHNKEARQLRDRVAKLSPSKKKDELKQRLRELDPHRRIVLGPNTAVLEPGGEGQQQIVRTLVQGHWKRQPFGPGRADRKLIFIEPYWQGPASLVTSSARAPSPVRPPGALRRRRQAFVGIATSHSDEVFGKDRRRERKSSPRPVVM